MPATVRSAAAAPHAKPAVACSSCCLKGVCLPCDLGQSELDSFDEITTAKRRVARGASLYHSGERFESLFAVRSGSFKTVGVSRQGDEKITGFHLPGELLGLEAISSDRYGYGSVALEDSEVCIIPFTQLEQMAMSMPALQHQLLRLLSGDISRDQGLMLLLGSMSAEQRLSAFLLSLSRRHKRLGFAANRFVLRMTREEIGNYLGLTLETVSRMLSRFQREGLVAVQQREIELKNVDGLMDMVGHW
ncbi:MAG: fumarate/nitrate reduction transcriptional regulator Fnr [Betaproteobacteria bacterium]|nr:fumarate/nitrate reduction transcriptional regulator Fnr [Betaproteobacteria bacterium]MBI2509311.1 fumarate/nitrate reduction transcriptional regulator Fnr [Betaproteobacteria bacterium]